MSVLIGAALVVAGGWLLAGRQLPTVTPKPATGPAVRARFGSMVLFGAAYAVASLGCTIGPFLAVVVAGLLLVLTGGYVAWYGWYEIRLFSDAA